MLFREHCFPYRLRKRGTTKDLKESEASHEAEGYPHTGGTKEDSIGECFVSIPATIYVLRLCTKEWC